MSNKPPRTRVVLELNRDSTSRKTRTTSTGSALDIPDPGGAGTVNAK